MSIVGTWTYVNALRAEHAEYLAAEGVVVPPLAPHNRAPTEADVAAAYAALGAVDPLELAIDCYREDGGLTVKLRGRADRALAFALGLAKRCGQLYLFPFPDDAMPGVVVDPDGDPAELLRAALASQS